MPTVLEALKATGLTDEQISALDKRVVDTFGNVLTNAEQLRAQADKDKADASAETAKAETQRQAAVAAQEAAELAQRSNKDFYDTTIAPALTGWEDKEKTLQQLIADSKAEAAFYKTQAEAAKDSGFVPKDAPKFTAQIPNADPARNDKGQYVANAPGATPGSPTLIDEMRSAFTDTTWAMQEFQRLTGGQYLPDDITLLGREAATQKLPFRDYVERKYNFPAKREDMKRKQQEAHDDEVKKTVAAEMTAQFKVKEEELNKTLAEERRKFAENTGNNPDVKPNIASRMAEVHRAVKDNQRADPLTMSDTQRQQATRKAIHDKLLDNQGAAT